MKKQLILCPVDYSECTEPAIGIAADLASANNAKVILLHVIEPAAKPLSIDELYNQRFHERFRDQNLDQHEIEHEHVTRHGNPSTAIIDYASKNKVAKIVMGTHGRTGLANVLVGSVAKRVMANATCPVITVKMPVVAGNS